MTSSIVFADDGDDDDEGSNCSIQSADDVSKPDTRRGILRNRTNNHEILNIDKRSAQHLIYSPSRSHRPVRGPDSMLQGGPGIFWPDWEITKQHYYRNSVSQAGDTTDRGQTGNEASRVESWETHETGSNGVARKKHTVRFSPEADDACTIGIGQGTHLSDEFKGQVHAEQVQGHPERRRLNVGRIAENKFNDGRNMCYISDAGASMTKTDSPKVGRKWYHFSFRSNKNRDKAGAKVESQSRIDPQTIYAEPRSTDEKAKPRCRGRREMRETLSYEVNDTDNGYVRSLAAQGYRLLSSSVSEPEQLGGYGRRGGSSTQEWNQRVRSTTSTYDLRRSPTVRHDDRKWRGAAVRRSRSTVGDDRRRQTTSSPTPSMNIPTRRNSTDLADDSPSATMKAISALANGPGALPTPNPSPLGWYYGLGGTFDRQLAATTHDATYYVRQSEQQNLATSVEPKLDETEKSDAGYCNTATAGGEVNVVWSGQSWTTPRQLRTSMTPVEVERNRTVMLSNGESTNHAMNSILSSNVASNYIVRRESFVPVTRMQGENWTLEKHWNVVRALPEIQVTPATDECRQRRFPTSEKPLLPATTIHSQHHPRDYTAIYAWSSELPATTAMKRSATFGEHWNPTRSNADGYIEPAKHRGVPMVYPADRQLCSTADQRPEGPRFFSRSNCSYCGDFIDMRGICRAVVAAADLLQIELFYRSHKTEVISCACAARLYFASIRRHSSILGSGAAPTQPEVADAARWYPTTAVGVPVIVLDCGGSRCRDRKLSLVSRPEVESRVKTGSESRVETGS